MQNACHESTGLFCDIFEAHINSHHCIATDGVVLITAFLGAREIQFGVWGWKLLQRSRGRATHSSVPAMELHLWHTGHLQLTEVILSLCQGAGLVSDPIFQGLSLPRQGCARQGSGRQSSAAKCGAFVWCLLCCWSHWGARAEQPCTGTKQLCCHSCNHTRECFARVVYSSCIR